MNERQISQSSLGHSALLLADIKRLAHQLAGQPLNIMEVCGTHTMAIYRHGLRSLLPENIHLISGPGCPVCVTPQGVIDAMIEIARQPNVIVCTFGDMLKVPGSESSLQEERARGAVVQVTYSPMDALHIAKKHPGQEVVFLAVGFETTAPGIAATLRTAANEGISNFSVFPAMKLIPPALKALFSNPQLKIDGLLLPGHVSVILGCEAFQFIPTQYHCPCAIAGFEPGEILDGIHSLIEQAISREAVVANCYTPWVAKSGNLAAKKLLDEIFNIKDAAWRGLGTIPCSGYYPHDHSPWDALKKFQVEIKNISEPPGCRCGEIISGISSPLACPLFGKNCLPNQPVGPCMVSSEGACAAAYKYGR